MSKQRSRFCSNNNWTHNHWLKNFIYMCVKSHYTVHLLHRNKIKVSCLTQENRINRLHQVCKCILLLWSSLFIHWKCGNQKQLVWKAVSSVSFKMQVPKYYNKLIFWIVYYIHAINKIFKIILLHQIYYVIKHSNSILTSYNF